MIRRDCEVQDSVLRDLDVLVTFENQLIGELSEYGELKDEVIVRVWWGAAWIGDSETSWICVNNCTSISNSLSSRGPSSTGSPTNRTERTLSAVTT